MRSFANHSALDHARNRRERGPKVYAEFDSKAVILIDLHTKLLEVDWLSMDHIFIFSSSLFIS